jgi:pimeloyl-ACP methyl ester carboxylesterase
MHAHIGASARIKDMDMLREALGESRLHLVGVGRGGWVATRYAERYPDRVGRVLLDSTWDIDGSVVEAMEARVEERGRTIRRSVATVTDAPERYGWGTEPMDIHRRIGALPRWTREAWAGRIANVPDLLAVLAMGRLLEHDASLTVDGLRASLATTRLSGNDDDDQAARKSAGKLLDEIGTGLGTDTYGFGTRASGSSPSQIASVFATRCNDGSWGTKQRYWRQRTHELRDAWPFSVGNETFQGMVCSTWHAAFGQSQVPVLAPSVSILMAHAEFDDEAPLRHAVLGLHGHVTAKMVVARGLRAHGMAIRSDRPCVSEVTGRFLAEGILPANKLTNCAMPDPAPVP